MATFVQTNVKQWLDEFDISANFNACSLAVSADLKDDTVYGDTTRSVAGGLRTVQWEGEGYWDSTADATLFTQVGLADAVVSIGPVDGAETSPAYLMQLTAGQYSPMDGEVGEMAAFRVSGEGRGGVGAVSGQIFVNRTSVVASSNSGTAVQLGAVTATQYIAAALHVIAASGTLDVTVKSDDAVGFASPTTRITFAQATAVGSEFASAAGPITDDYWRVDFTVTGSFDFVVTVGIR